MAAGLRDAGFYGDVTLIGSEPDPPYERPHLSKGFLAGTVPREKLWLRPRAQYRELEIDLVLGRRVSELGLDGHRVLLEDGKTIGWDVLCLATGSDARRLPQVEPARYLRELAGARTLRAVIDQGEALEIVGAGFIGCEVAAVAAEKGCKVRVHEALEQPLMRVLGPELGGYLAALHRRHGVDLNLNVSALPAMNRPLVAIGSTPRTRLAEASRIEVDRGIVVDAFGRTSVEGVFAAGDATCFFSPLYEQHIRVEHFQTSQRQGFAVGRAMAGAAQPYSEVPWFWSDQYEVNLQYAGAGLAWDELITRGEFGHPPFTVFYLRGGGLVGAAGINDHHTIARIRHVMEARKPVSPQQLADPNLDLRKLLA
ncbi:MAG TPA: FAD-dependent oxidoreductase [Candidatus Acidoferrum sp.]|nr:FAD-dependent oxidoreductase [Candidatus Acidoferrum sp.]